MDEQRMIGHRQDRSFENLNGALFEATWMGDEAQINALQDEMRKRFGHLL